MTNEEAPDDEEASSEKAPATENNEVEMQKMSAEMVELKTMISKLTEDINKIKAPVTEPIKVTKKVDNFSTQENTTDTFSSVLNKFIKNKK